jgi:hypothetical protein
MVLIVYSPLAEVKTNTQQMKTEYIFRQRSSVLMNIYNQNFTENNKNKMWKERKNNAKQTILYFDTFS